MANGPSWEFRHLVALIALAETGSFGRAAERLGYTQSAVSQQIAALERLLGARLVHRPGGPRPISLTAAGERLADHARAILRRAELAEADVRATLDEGAPTVRLGTFQSVAVRVLPTLLRRFQERRPDVTVELVEHAGDEGLLDLVERGHLDLAFALLPVGDGPFAWRHLMNGEYVLITATDAVPRDTGLAEISRLPLIGYQNLRKALRMEEYLAAHGHTPQVVFRTDGNEAIQRLVGVGMGAALVPAFAVDDRDEKITVTRPSEELPPFIIGVAWHADRPLHPAAAALLELAADVCGELQDPRLAPS
ncbi:LysR family transcriptional regulator [Actinomadura vinacea]|uniref:LysR family transcriptional regulator n=1 Tax=Actinomadura vinacea TaxID=115336 RepID=A0ABN3IBX0_9ACTN